MIGVMALQMLIALTASDTAARDTTRRLTLPPWREASVSANAEWFASRLNPWLWETAAVRYRGKSATHSVELFSARRFDTWNAGAAFEETRTITSHSYVDLRAQLAPHATVIARSDLSAAWYQATGHGWEIVPAIRVMSFAAARVPIYGVAVGRYSGLWYAAARLNQAAYGGSRSLTTSAELRRYASDASPDYVDLTLATGEDITPLGPSVIALRRTAAVALRGQRMVTRSLGLSIAATYDHNASLPERHGGSVTGFVRW